MPEKDKLLVEILTGMSILLVQEGLFGSNSANFCSLRANQAGQSNLLTPDGHSMFNRGYTLADMLDRQSKITKGMLFQYDTSGGESRGLRQWKNPDNGQVLKSVGS